MRDHATNPFCDCTDSDTGADADHDEVAEQYIGATHPSLQLVVR